MAALRTLAHPTPDPVPRPEGSADLERHPFTFIPHFIQSARRLKGGRGLSDGEALLLLLLLSYDRPDPRFGGQRKGYVWPARATLAAALALGERALRKHLAGLRAAGVIRDMTTAEVRHFQDRGCDLPDAGRGGRGWKIHYDHLWGLRLVEEKEEEDEEAGPPAGAAGESSGHAERNRDSTLSGTIVPLSIEESGKAEDPGIPHHHPCTNYNSSATIKEEANRLRGGGGEILPSPSSPETAFQGEVLPLTPARDRRPLQQTLQEWAVSPPQSRKIVAHVPAPTIRYALNLLQRDQALPRTHQIIHRPPGWLQYTLFQQRGENLDTWEERITAAEEATQEPLAGTPSPPCPWRNFLAEALEKHGHYLDPRTVLPGLLQEFPPTVKDSTIAGFLMARNANGSHDYDSWLATVQQARQRANRETSTETSANPPEAGVPTYTVELETQDHPGTCAAVPAGRKQVLLRYDHSPAVPPEEEMNVYDPERTLPATESYLKSPEVNPEPQVPAGQREGGPDPTAAAARAEAVDPEAAAAVRALIAQSLAEAEQAERARMPRHSAEVTVALSVPDGREEEGDGEKGEPLEEPEEPEKEAEEAEPGPALPPGETAAAEGGVSRTLPLAWPPDAAACARMWQYVRTHLEQEEQWLPFLHQVFLHWDGAGLRLCAPERAIAWALANRQPRLQTLLQRYTGRSLTIEVPQEPLPHPRE